MHEELASREYKKNEENAHLHEELFLRNAKKNEENAHYCLNGWIPWLFDGTRKERAAESFSKAAGLYAVAKQHEEAAKCYDESAKLLENTSNKYEAATTYINCGKFYRLAGKVMLVKIYYKKGIAILVEQGKHLMAGVMLYELGESLQKDNLYGEALECYIEACDYFDAEFQFSRLNNTWSKMAEIYIKLNDFLNAARYFEKIAMYNFSENILRFLVKDYFFLCCLCLIAHGDFVNVDKHYKRFCDLDVYFSTGKEHYFIEDIISSLKFQSLDQFIEILTRYKKHSILDEQKCNILLAIKGNFKENDDLC